MAVRALAMILGGAGVAVALCWSMFAPAEVAQEQVESGTLAQVAAASSDTLRCEGGLKARVGAAQSCTLTRGGEKFAVNLQVTDVGGGQVSWDSTVAAVPRSGPRVPVAELERRTREVLALQRPVESVTCDGALTGTVGATQSCVMVTQGRARSVTVTVATVNADHVRWGVTVG